MVDDNTITVYIKRIRSKIEENPKEPKYLKTIRESDICWRSDKNEMDQGNKGKRQAAIGAVFLVVFLSLVMALSCAEFYKRYKEQVIHTEESQLLTIAGIIGNNLDMFLNEQLEQIDLLLIRKWAFRGKNADEPENILFSG